MKKLFSILTVAAALTFATNNANAQENFMSAGLEIAIPIGDWADAGVNFGIGASGTYEFGISEKLSVLAHAGVIFYATDDIEIPTFDPVTLEIGTKTLDYSVTQIPIQIGGRYYLSEQKDGLFLSALLGVHITSVSLEDASDSSTDFSFAPEVGYFLTEAISVGLRYQIVSGDDVNSDYLGVRAAYNF